MANIIAYDLATENNDFIFKDGDFFFEDSNQQHAEAIMLSNKGDFREFPDVGLGINSFLNSPGYYEAQLLEQQARAQFQKDGFKIQDLDVIFDLATNNLTVKTNAIRQR